MAIAYVRDTGKVTSDGGGAGTATINMSFASLPTVGNHVFALLGWWGSPSTSVTFSDNQSNTWANDAQMTTPDEGQGTGAIGSAKVATSSGTFTITGTGGSGSYWKGIGVEFSGVKSAGHKDQSGTATTEDGQTSITVTASGANTQADALVLAVMGSGGNGSNMNIGHPPSGYTGLAVEQDSVTVCAFEACYKIVSASETSACTWTHDFTATEGCGAALVTYKPEAGGGGPTGQPTGKRLGAFKYISSHKYSSVRYW